VAGAGFDRANVRVNRVISSVRRALPLVTRFRTYRCSAASQRHRQMVCCSIARAGCLSDRFSKGPGQPAIGNGKTLIAGLVSADPLQSLSSPRDPTACMGLLVRKRHRKFAGAESDDPQSGSVEDHVILVNMNLRSVAVSIFVQNSDYVSREMNCMFRKTPS
jgi:hypothetical protein